MNLLKRLPKIIALTVATACLCHQAFADSITISETLKDNTTGGIWSSTSDSGTFTASLTVPGLSSLAASDWANLSVTINSGLTLGFTGGMMAEALDYGGSYSANNAIFYFQGTDLAGNGVNAMKMTFSRSGNTLTVVGQTLNPASLDYPWTILTGNYYETDGPFTDIQDFEISLDESNTGLSYALAKMIFLAGTNKVTFDIETNQLFNLSVKGSADFTPPTLTAVSPTSSATVSNALLFVQVKATDAFGVANVEFYFDGLDYGPGLFDGTNKWSKLLALLPGTNLIQTIAADSSGNGSTNKLTMTYVNKQTNANLITFTEHWLDTPQWFGDWFLAVPQDVGVVNVALLVPGLQAMSADTWSNLSLNVEIGDVNFANTLNAADLLTPSSATFLMPDGSGLKVSRAGNTLILALAGDYEPNLATNYHGQAGTILDTTSFNLTLTDDTTTYADVSQTVYITGNNVIINDGWGNELDNIQITGAADFTPPTNTITTPISGQKWSNAVFTVTGTARDNIGVDTVFYSINSSDWTAANSLNNWTNWTAQVSLTPGTNTIQAYALDFEGNVSTTNTVKLVYVLSAPLQMQITGLGTVAPNYNNVLLPLGQNYSITSTPTAGFAFTNWVVSTNWIGGAIFTKTNLSFLMVSNLTLQANFMDVARPTNTITAPTANQSWSNALFTVTGTAKDNMGVSNVFYSLNGSAWSNAMSANGWSNWTAQVTLAPGTNSLKAYALDTTGNKSLTNAVSVVYIVSAQLQLRTVGLGTSTPNYSNAWLQIGKSYSITSAPASGFKFTGWTMSTNWLGGATVTNKTIAFSMVSNLTLLATFIDTNRPTLTISSPTAGQKMTNALATVIGTASDNWKVTGVWYQLNSNAWNLVTTTNSYTNWTQTVALLAGTNTLKAYALDLGRNFSLTNSLSVVSSNAFKLQLAFNAAPLTASGLNLNLQLSPGLNGHIQFSTNLLNWATLTNFVGTNTSLTIRDPAATNAAKRFYRAVVP